MVLDAKARVAQDSGQLLRRQVPVLVAQRGDGGVDDGGAPRQEVGNVFRRREDAEVAGFGKGAQELPGRARLRQIFVDSDVARA
jgi:hypothetical protein